MKEDALSLAGEKLVGHVSAFVFDFDGTLADTESVHFLSYNALLEKRYGFALCLDEFMGYVGRERGTVLARIKERHSIDFDDEEFSNERLHIFLGLLHETKLQPFSYFACLCNVCPQTPSFIVSAQNKSLLKKMLGNWGMETFFTEVLTTDEQFTKIERYRQLCQRFDLSFKETLLFEDSKDNLIAGKSLGMYTAGVRTCTNRPLPPECCDTLIDMRDECILNSYYVKEQR